MRKVIYLFAALFFLTTVSISQPYYFRHYQVENGLSNNTVGCMLQDHKGFMWFGTKDGLNRFDGYTFKVFQNQSGKLNSIGSNFIISLYEDRNRQLWVGTDYGLFKYNAEKEEFFLQPQVPAEVIRGIALDDHERLWLIIRNRLGWLDLRSKKFSFYKQLQREEVTSVSLSAGGSIWVTTARGLIHKLNTSSLSIETLDVFNSQTPSTTRGIQKVYDTGKGFLLVGTASHGLYVLDTLTKTFLKKNLPEEGKSQVFIRDFAQFNKDEYWIASESGLFVYNFRTDKIIHLKKHYGDPYSLSDNAIYSLWLDKEGGMWVGSYFGGINYYPKQFTCFQKYFPQSTGNTINGNAIHEVCKDKNGNLWIGTEDAGLNRLNPATGVFTHFTPYSARYKVSHTNIHGLLVNGNEIWVGTFHGGLDVIDINTGQLLKHYSALKHSLKSDFVCDLIKTRSGRILIATDRGLCYFNPAEDKFEPVKNIPPVFYKHIYEAGDGTIWAGSYSEGLFYYNPHTNEKGSFKYESASGNSIINNRINWIFEDARKQLWVGTEGGLSRFNRDKKTFTNYTTENGFPGNLIYAVLEDNKGDFWITTSKGLVNFSPLTEEVRAVYTQSDGLLTDQFNYNSAFNDNGKTLYFGSVKGLISFVPNSFETNTYKPPTYLTGFQINNKEVSVASSGSPLKQSIIYSKEITLRHNQSSFSIDFAALSFTTPDATEYAYIMKGLDQDWTYLKSNRKVFFTELSSGTYIFTVKSAVSREAWSSEYALLTIRVLPPFWKSKWAYLIYVLLAIIAVFAAIRSYHRYHLEKNKRRLELLEFKKQKEISQAKVDFFTDVAHEIKTPLTLIKGPMEKIMDDAEDPSSVKANLKIIEKNTDRLIELTKQLLDFRKVEADAFNINAEKTDMVALLNDHYLRFLISAEQKNIEFELIHPSSFTAFVDIEAMNKIISNLFDNAIKYANKSVVVELLPLTESDIEFTILFKNDGILIPAKMKDKIFETFFRLKETERLSGSGIGLSLARSLAQLHGGNLILMENQESLNIFALTLPVNNH